MKTKQMIDLWRAYAVKVLKSSNYDLGLAVRMLNRNNKHRAQFNLVGNKIMFKDTVVLDMEDANQNPAVNSIRFEVA